jgi:hypothetical protein
LKIFVWRSLISLGTPYSSEEAGRIWSSVASEAPEAVCAAVDKESIEKVLIIVKFRIEMTILKL